MDSSHASRVPWRGPRSHARAFREPTNRAGCLSLRPVVVAAAAGQALVPPEPIGVGAGQPGRDHQEYPGPGIIQEEETDFNIACRSKGTHRGVSAQGGGERAPSLCWFFGFFFVFCFSAIGHASQRPSGETGRKLGERASAERCCGPDAPQARAVSIVEENFVHMSRDAPARRRAALAGHTCKKVRYGGHGYPDGRDI